MGKGDVHYGRIEARARLPVGKGSWAAIWMLPSDPFRYASNCVTGDAWQGVDSCDAWPNSGEIDIMEHVGYEAGHIHGTVHNRAYYWRNWQQRKGRILVEGVGEDFHVYALEWTPERIDIFVDDVRYFTYMNEGAGWRGWPYDHPFHLVLNLAIGGAWGRAGGGIDDRAFPQRMEVDYVRVFRKAP
jgi:beta-glucanase (GH16 family)